MAVGIAEPTGGALRRKRAVRLGARDRITIGLMVGVPMVVVGGLIWFPTVASILLSFTNWDGIGGITSAHWIGTENYRQIATIYPPFWPAVEHNLIWLGFLTFVATPFGLLDGLTKYGSVVCGVPIVDGQNLGRLQDWSVG